MDLVEFNLYCGHLAITAALAETKDMLIEVKCGRAGELSCGGVS